MRVHRGEKAVFGFLPFRPGRATREIAADDGKFLFGCVKAQFDITAFGVELATIKSNDDIAGRMARIDAYAGVAFFFSVMKMAVQASKRVEGAFYICGLGFDFLYTNTIGFGFFEPSFYAFLGGRSNSVEVEAGEFEQGFPR